MSDQLRATTLRTRPASTLVRLTARPLAVPTAGDMCGALTGAALAVGMLAERRVPGRARAKHVAGELVAWEKAVAAVEAGEG
jgi:hypothetical protein